MPKRARCILLSVLLLICMATFVFYVTNASVLPFLNAEAEDAFTIERDLSFYLDIKSTDWFLQDVRYISDKGIMNGIGRGCFAPYVPTTRGMLVTILWRLDGEPAADMEPTFTDIEKESFYYTAVTWAIENKIVLGYDALQFGPDDPVTREQMVSILCRYIAYKGYDCNASFDLSLFKDDAEISDYAKESLKWALHNEIIVGTSDNCVSPKDNALRCQFAAVIHRICEKFSIQKAPYVTMEVQKEFDEAEFGNDDKTFLVKQKGNKPSVSASYKNESSKDSASPDNLEEEEKEVDYPPTSSAVSYENKDNEAVSQNHKLPTIAIRTVKATIGHTVTVEAEIQNNPGILGMTLCIEYDTSALQLLRAKSREAVDNVLTFTPSKNLQSSSKLAWDGLYMRPDDVRDGVFLELEFAITEDAKHGERYPVTVQFGPSDIVDFELKEIVPKVIDGYIVIE